MEKIHYITSNQSKFNNAKSFFTRHNISLIQTSLDIYEIQELNAITVAESKAQQAWEKLKEPLFINDACWIIPALNGFPGPYMKYINNWFVPQDFINLMQNKLDRTVILKDTIIYVNDKGSKIFTNDHHGTILGSAYFGKYKNPSDAVISLSKSGKSLAEELANNNFFLEGEDAVWIKFINWLKTEKK